MLIDKDLIKKIKSENSDFVINTAKVTDATKLATLMNRHYKRKFSADYFHWRYLDKNTRAQLFVLRKKSDIVGMSGVERRFLSSGESAGVTCDVLIDREFQGRGLLVLLEYAVEEFCRKQKMAVIVVFANETGMKSMIKAGNRKLAGTITMLEYDPSDINKLAKNKQFQEYRKQSDLVYFQSDPSYRYWRFVQNPWYQYNKIKAGKNKFAYTKLFVEPLHKTNFGDIVYYSCPDDESALRSLFIKTINSFPPSIKIITTWAVPHTLAYKVCHNLGFRDTDKQTFFCLKVLDSKVNYLYDFERWHLLESDSEVY